METIKAFATDKAKTFLDGNAIFIVGPEETPIGYDPELVMFTGPRALTRAIEYTEWKNGRPIESLAEEYVEQLADEHIKEHQQR